MDDKEYKEALRMIDKLYKELYLSYEVTHRVENVTNDKFENLESYIDRLDKIHKRAKGNPKLIRQLKNYYYYKYVIKPENIPESYYQHQQQLAFERGLGRIEINDYMKSQYQKNIVNDQKKSLDLWIDYFLSDDSDYMPMWAKFWAFEGMLKLGNYDKEKGLFNKRSKSTTSIFADLNREALSLSIDYLRKSLNNETIEDKDLKKLLKDGSFGKIYLYFIKELEKNKEKFCDNDEGIWIKYDRGSDHMPLVRSLQGYNTGWCTAGESTAKFQLEYGDFYVYYTKDENGEYKVPRIAIRMEGNEIGEIRGVAPDQNLEANMENIVEEKIKDFPDKDEYNKKVSDMKKLTIIYNKNKNKEELNKDELMFLYEINEKVVGFGWEDDPRVSEIIESRNLDDDLAIMFDVTKDQVASTMEDLMKNPDNIVILRCNLVLKDDKIKFPNLKYIFGNVHCENLTSADIIPSIESIQGNTYFNSIKNANGLENLKTIMGDAHFESLEDGSGLCNLEKIGFSAYFYSLKSISDLVNLKNIGWDAHFNSLIKNDISSNLFVYRRVYLNSLLKDDSDNKNFKFSYDDNEYYLFENNINIFRNFKKRVLAVFSQMRKTKLDNTGLFKKIANSNDFYIYSFLFQKLYNQCESNFDINEFFISEYSDYINVMYDEEFLRMSQQFLNIILEKNCSHLKEEKFENILNSIISDYESKKDNVDFLPDNRLGVQNNIYDDFDYVIKKLDLNLSINLEKIKNSNIYIEFEEYLNRLFCNYYIKNYKYTEQDFINVFKMVAEDNGWMYAPESLQFDIMDEIVKLAKSFNVDLDIGELVNLNNNIISRRI